LRLLGWEVSFIPISSPLKAFVFKVGYEAGFFIFFTYCPNYIKLFIVLDGPHGSLPRIEVSGVGSRFFSDFNIFLSYLSLFKVGREIRLLYFPGCMGAILWY
jgi:hypothetical protein